MSDAQDVEAMDYLVNRMPWDLSRPRFMDFQRETLRERIDADPDFAGRLRRAAIDLLTGGEDRAALKALTALAIVGEAADISLIDRAMAEASPSATNFSKTCIFEIEKREKRRPNK